MTAQEVYSIGQVDPCNSGMWHWHIRSVSLLEFSPTQPSEPCPSVCQVVGLYVCLSASSQKIHFRRLWRPLVKDCVFNIVIGGQSFQKKCDYNFFPESVKWSVFNTPPPKKENLDKNKTYVLRLWSKNPFLKLFCDDIIFKKGGGSQDC